VPIGSVPAVPTDDWGPTWFTAGVAALLAAAAMIAIRRRQAAP
jgi:hypothetical protein